MSKFLKSFFILSLFVSTTSSYAQCVSGYITSPQSTPFGDCTVAANTTLLITSNMNLSGITIALEDNAKIRLAPNVTLHLSGVGFVACNYNNDLWDRIEIPYASSTLIMDNSCRLTDSKEGVYSENGGNFQLSDSDFYSNLSHLVVKNYPGNHPGSITNCELFNTQSSNLIPSSSDYESAVYIENVGHVQIGNVNNPKNEITDGKYGIYSTNSSVTIENNHIELFTDTGDKGVFNEGGQNLIVRKNWFKKCEIGIEQDHLQSSLVKDNQFSIGQRGIFLKDCRTSNVTLNTIKPISGEAIEVRNMANSYPINVTNNVVSVADIGIVAQSFPVPTLTYPDINISGNTLFHTRIGILGSYLKTLHNINENTIFYEQTGNSPATQGVGIYLKKSWYTTIENNHITDDGALSSNSPSSNGIGILNEESAHTTVIKNKVIGANKGIAYMNNFSHVNIECNTLQDCYDGFYFDGSTSVTPFEVIGDDTQEVSAGNRWVNIINWRILNNSLITLDWHYNNGNTPDYDPTIAMTGSIIPDGSNPDPNCWPAPPRLAQNQFEFKIYPNPSAGKLTIELSEENGSIQLFNLMGQMVFEQALTQRENKININHLTPGVYQSKISSIKEVLTTEKIIISK